MRSVPTKLAVLTVMVAALCCCSSRTPPGMDLVPIVSVEAGVQTDRQVERGRGGDRRATDQEVVPPGVVSTDKGKVQGTVSVAYRSFLGIPYAAPPLGPLRWVAPQPHAAWSTPLDASKLGPGCPQLASLQPLLAGTSEDCLTLNVWTPSPQPSAPAPVMVWIHGGAFTQGGSAVATYDGRALAEKHGVVVVTFNYRLGPLGFLAHKSLGAASGNYGLLDQQAALRWVKTNIAAFGGDPGRVTLFGESAGAVSVCLHLVAPGSAGLFHAAVLESGTCLSSAPHQAEAEAQGVQLAGALGCASAADPAACLRAKTVDELLKALPLKPGVIFGAGASWGPHVDGATLPDEPRLLLQKGAFAKVPTLLGSNTNEGSLFVAAAGLTGLTVAQYWQALGQAYGPRATEVLAHYPAAAYASPAGALADVLTDGGFVCTARRLARALTGTPAYLYTFAHAPSFAAIPLLGVYHGAEVPFVFGNAPAGAAFTAAEATLSSSVGGYWTRLARSGDPNGPAAVTWPRHEALTDKHLVLDLTIAAGSGLKKSKCDFWDTVVP